MEDDVLGTSRTRVRRQPGRGRYDRDEVYRVVDAGLHAHVAFVDGDTPFCIPMLHARIGDEIYVHGSSASRALRTLGRGVAACVTVTMVRALVLARSAFEHSANYESAIILGSFRPVVDDDEKVAAFEAFTEKLLPGRWDEVRGPNARELKASAIVAMPIAEASVKARSGPPSDDDTDDAREVHTWAGEIPLVARFGTPVPSPGLAPGTPLAESVERLSRGEP